MQKLTRNNIVLLVCLMALVLFYPLFTVPKGLVLHILLSAIIVSGIYSCSFRQKTKRILLITGTTTIAAIWLDFFFRSDILRILTFGTIFAFIVIIVFYLIRHIARSDNITATLILSAVNGYLLIGLLGSLLLDIADIAGGLVAATAAVPAINFAGGTADSFHDYLYFSFVTLTTLGYGDITPVSAATKSIALIIAVTGQFYLTILVAMLVGKYLSQKNR
jgi:uncharacterized membrane protein